MTAKGDVSGSSDGYELAANYGYEFGVGFGSFTPSVGFNHLSKNMSNYYYGTLGDEVSLGVVNYKPGAVTIPKIGLTYSQSLGERWQFVSVLQYKFLPNDISDSPLIEDGADGQTSVMLGISRDF